MRRRASDGGSRVKFARPQRRRSGPPHWCPPIPQPPAAASHLPLCNSMDLTLSDTSREVRLCTGARDVDATPAAPQSACTYGRHLPLPTLQNPPSPQILWGQILRCLGGTVLLRPRCMECLPGAEDVELVTESYCFCPLTPHMSGLVQYLSPGDWLLSLRKMSPRSIHAVPL